MLTYLIIAGSLFLPFLPKCIYAVFFLFVHFHPFSPFFMWQSWWQIIKLRIWCLCLTKRYILKLRLKMYSCEITFPETFNCPYTYAPCSSLIFQMPYNIHGWEGNSGHLFSISPNPFSVCLWFLLRFVFQPFVCFSSCSAVVTAV